jgi:hypothetical protein
VKYRKLPQFEADYNRLSQQERKTFKEALQVFIASCKQYEIDPAGYVWPAALRFERLSSSKALAITWSFAGPDGRATFHFETSDDEMYVVWRRVGRHSIYRNP